jgi:hypothetical protein
MEMIRELTDVAVTIKLPWDKGMEETLQAISNKCKALSLSHQKARDRNRWFWILFGLPSMLVPLVTGGVGAYLEGEYEWVRSVALLTTAMNSGILQFFNFGERRSLYNESSWKFGALGELVDQELSKPRQFRIPCNIFMDRVFNNFQQIKAQSPVV